MSTASKLMGSPGVASLVHVCAFFRHSCRCRPGKHGTIQPVRGARVARQPSVEIPIQGFEYAAQVVDAGAIPALPLPLHLGDQEWIGVPGLLALRRQVDPARSATSLSRFDDDHEVPLQGGATVARNAAHRGCGLQIDAVIINEPQEVRDEVEPRTMAPHVPFVIDAERRQCLRQQCRQRLHRHVGSGIPENHGPVRTVGGSSRRPGLRRHMLATREAAVRDAVARQVPGQFDLQLTGNPDQCLA